MGGLNLGQGVDFGGNSREVRKSRAEEPIVEGLKVEVEEENVIVEKKIKGGQNWGKEGEREAWEVEKEKKGSPSGCGWMEIEY